MSLHEDTYPNLKEHPYAMPSRNRENLSKAEGLFNLIAGGGLVLYGLRRKSTVPLALLGGALTYRGITRHCPLYEAAGVDHSDEPDQRTAAVTIQRPIEEIYRFCSDMRNFPQFISFLKDVRPDTNDRFHWSVQPPAGPRRNFTVQVCERSEPNIVRWRSLDDAPLHVEGALQFSAAPGNRGTQVRGTVEFRDRGAKGLLAGLAKPFAKYKLRHDLGQLKQVMESGEVISTKGQPSGRGQEKSCMFMGEDSEIQPVRENGHALGAHGEQAATAS